MFFLQREFFRALETKSRRALFFLREYFFPSGCALCGAGLITTEEIWYGLCETCRASLVNGRAGGGDGMGEQCDICGRPLLSERNRCLPCRNGEAPAFDRMIVIFPYTGKYRRLLGAYKFGKNLALGNFFAELIWKAIQQLTESRNEIYAVVPVPPRPGKIKKTGWDQIEYLAGLLERGWKIPILRCLKRLSSKAQKELDREDRKTNLKGRVILKGKKIPAVIAVIDDVTTTGSTMDICASVLKKGGAEKVYGCCLFYD